MDDYDNLESLKNLSETILAEVVREGEQKMQAQFDNAAASDIRAMTWIGFLVVITIASLGSSASLIMQESDLFLAGFGIGFSIFQFVAIIKAVDSVRPKKFGYPGNEPENWKPCNWHEKDPAKQVLKQARFEQAVALAGSIRRNKKTISDNADCLTESINTSLMGVVLIGIVLALFGFFAGISQ